MNELAKKNVSERKILAVVTQDRTKTDAMSLLLAYLFLLLGTASGRVSVHVLFCFLFISTLLLISLLRLKKKTLVDI